MTLSIFKMRVNVLRKIILSLFLNSLSKFIVLLFIELPLAAEVGKELREGLLLRFKIFEVVFALLLGLTLQKFFRLGVGVVDHRELVLVVIRIDGQNNGLGPRGYQVRGEVFDVLHFVGVLEALPAVGMQDVDTRKVFFFGVDELG